MDPADDPTHGRTDDRNTDPNRETLLKTVLLLRHAKSSWDQPHLPDSLRPLAPRGSKAAPRVGAYMAEKGIFPERVLCSNARRAVETWKLVSQHLGGPMEVEVREDIYHASPGSILSILRDLPDSEGSVLLVGHNPTFEILASLLAGDGEAEARASLGRKFPTGALAVLDFPAQRWSDLSERSGYLRAFVRPRDLEP